ncbi:hypothetical protein M8C21_003243 [Ambrosia artemisiifolia]|uniref:F-box domain-containing protein n=1 Tax=Ambrosia artemisiifolia TaxID=4212 RepID=A0AAD5CID4_AMBAR|nr:hypothetical protein M8C21_003243 [Ambrosia artemisiifolia]
MGGSSSINHSRHTFYVPPNVLSDEPRLIPGLVDEISLQILARTPRIGYLSLKAVSRSWKAAVTSPEIYHIRKQLGTTEEWLYMLINKGLDGCVMYALDTVSKRWQTLPRIPNRGLSSFRIIMPCAKAHPTAFLLGSHDQVKLGLASYRGKLYVPQLFCHLSLLTIGGEVYDPETNLWVDMPTGMAQGWPACLGTRLSVIVDGNLYAPRRVTSSVGLLGRLHIVTVDDNVNIVVMRADKRDDGDSESYIWNAIASGNFGETDSLKVQKITIPEQICILGEQVAYAIGPDCEQGTHQADDSYFSVVTYSLMALVVGGMLKSKIV